MALKLPYKRLILQAASSFRSAPLTVAVASAVPIQFKRFNSIPASDILNRSPYEEIQVEIDVKSTKDKPMKVNAYGDERTIACVCDDMRFMTLKKGPPVKCQCGYWFQLVDAKKFWDQDADHQTDRPTDP